MDWPRLRKSKAEPGQRKKERAAPPDPLLARLAEKLDQLPAQDELRIREAKALEELQNRGARQIHDLCRTFVDSLNELLENMALELSPPEFGAQGLGETVTLFQINANGRIVQLTIYPREEGRSTEHFRIPYILRGSMRWFNQEFLDRQAVEEQPVFYCPENGDGRWRYLDGRTRRIGVVDREFLAAMLDQLL